ncbi:MAG: uridine kinase [Cytophagales bacterium]|nr:uridine kinase [Cytophagales bacterium]
MSKPFVVGITGGSGSGKTHFLSQLMGKFSENEICLISQDNYYKKINEQEKDAIGVENFDLPSAIRKEDFHNDLVKLIEGNTVELTEYTFNNSHIEPARICLKPAPIIVVEGIFTLYYEEIKNLLDLKLFVEAPDFLMMKRRILRDGKERGYDIDDVLHRYEFHVMPTYRKYILPGRYEADFIIPNENNFDRALEVVTAHLRSLI